MAEQERGEVGEGLRVAGIGEAQGRGRIRRRQPPGPGEKRGGLPHGLLGGVHEDRPAVALAVTRVVQGREQKMGSGYSPE